MILYRFQCTTISSLPDVLLKPLPQIFSKISSYLYYFNGLPRITIDFSLKKKNILIFFLKKIMLIVVTRWKIDNYLLKISQIFQILLLFFQIPLMFCCSIDNLLLLKYATLCGVIFNIGI